MKYERVKNMCNCKEDVIITAKKLAEAEFPERQLEQIYINNWNKEIFDIKGLHLTVDYLFKTKKPNRRGEFDTYKRSGVQASMITKFKFCPFCGEEL